MPSTAGHEQRQPCVGLHLRVQKVWRRQERDRTFIAGKELRSKDKTRLEMVTNSTRELSREAWAQVRNQLEQICYWNMLSPETEKMGNDGAIWILEGSREHRYQIVERWSPAWS